MKIPSLQSRESKGGRYRELSRVIGSNRELSRVIESNRELSRGESKVIESRESTFAFHFRFSTFDNSRSLSPFDHSRFPLSLFNSRSLSITLAFRSLSPLTYLSELITSSFLLRLISTLLLSFNTANPSWSTKDMYFLLTRWLLCVRINCCGVSRVSYSPSVLEIR